MDRPVDTRPALSRRLLRWIWGGYVVALFTATHIPIPPRLEILENQRDKLIHAAAYFVLTLLTGLAFAEFWRRSRWHFLAMIAGLALFGVLDETLQGPVGRSVDFFDWLADLAGVLLGGLICRRWLTSRGHVVHCRDDASTIPGESPNSPAAEPLPISRTQSPSRS